jgi:hypothetical protein
MEIKRNLCKIFWHRWRWFKTMHEDGKEQSVFRVCKVCGKVHYQKWHMGELIWVQPVEFTKIGASKQITDYNDK